MYKFIIILILLIFLFFMVRKAIREFLGKDQPSPVLQSKDNMLQDPVCKVYVTAETAVIEKMGGQTYYFCSPECAHSFKKHLAGL
ncbi:MAG: YHS domain-containing protein [Nitrospirae bacterium]|nr:YHS domain-containing protein [Nitrospirota bacterium]